MRFTQITYRHMAHSASIGERIRELSTALEDRFPEIERCRATVEEFRAPKQARNLKVTVDVRIAGNVLVSSAHGALIENVLREVFDDLRTRVEASTARPQAA